MAQSFPFATVAAGIPACELEAAEAAKDARRNAGIAPAPLSAAEVAAVFAALGVSADEEGEA